MLEKHMYCVKCQSGKTVMGQSPVVLRNGSVALKGKCPSCESTAFKIVSKDHLKAESKKVQAHSHAHLLTAFVIFAAGLAIGAILATVI